jgi:hypothetical protein
MEGMHRALEAKCYGPSKNNTIPISYYLFSNRIPVKVTADILGFVLITWATLYLSYKAAIYKGPRYALVFLLRMIALFLLRLIWNF